jgi:predicted RNase H-like HicB family nuclease
MVNITFRAEIFREDDSYVALCPELNVSSFGDSVEEAKKSLIEAIGAFLEECDETGSLSEVLEEAGFAKEGDRWVSRKPISEELLAITA